MDWAKASTELNKMLDPAAVKPPPKGKYGEYVDGYHVVTEANRIFGNGGWSYEITRLQETHRMTLGDAGNEQIRISFLCTVKVHVGDTFKEGSAVGMGAGKVSNTGDVIESAVKEAETDALKRALRTYGNTFGLALYDKSKAMVGTEYDPAADVAKIEAAMSGRDLLAALKTANNEHPAVIAARVDCLRKIVQGAPNEAALTVMQKAFSPDWEAVKDDAEYRLNELKGE